MLDEDQAQVVAHEDGPAVVLAGAGSGKTRCTTERAVRRLARVGLNGDSMVLLTFTNKAAREMRERLRARLPEYVALPWVGTFHSFGNQLLRRHGARIGVPTNATLMDAEDARRMLDALLAGPFADKQRRQEAIEAVETIAASGLDIAQEADLPGLSATCEGYGFGPVATARLLERLRRFEREKREAAMLDFTDLIGLPARLLREHADLREQVVSGLCDITVDEAQDTDAAQLRLLTLLAPVSRTVLLVGDDDQAIYEWRHARPQNMGDFIDQWDATVYRLERNYRSTPAVVVGGVALVSHNTQRLEKNPYAMRAASASDTIELCQYDDTEAMADGVAERIAATVQCGGSLGGIAVLYRRNRLARAMETALLKRGIVYRVKAGVDLLSYADVRMMLAAGRLAVNRRDIRALSRLAELVPGLGARGVSRLIAGGGDPLAGAGRLSPKAAAHVADLSAALDRLYACGPGELLEWCQRTPMVHEWLMQRARRSLGAQVNSTDDALERALRPIHGRMRAVQLAVRRRLDSLPASATATDQWAIGLEGVSTGADEAALADEPKVTLCTVHAAKGLEWREVHLFGFSEGLMPMARDGAVENLAEERRLGYVAITRAQDRVVLHHAERLDLGQGGSAQPAAVSRFLAELQSGQPVELVDRRHGAAAPGTGDNARDWLAEMRSVFG